MNYYISAFKQYFDFKGRASRKQYWYFILVHVIVSIALSFIAVFSGIGLLLDLYILFILIPSTSLCVRRIHDCDKSGWFILLPIYNIILLFMPGTKGDNRFGPDPKNEVL